MLSNWLELPLRERFESQISIGKIKQQTALCLTRAPAKLLKRRVLPGRPAHRGAPRVISLVSARKSGFAVRTQADSVPTQNSQNAWPSRPFRHRRKGANLADSGRPGSHRQVRTSRFALTGASSSAGLVVLPNRLELLVPRFTLGCARRTVKEHCADLTFPTYARVSRATAAGGGAFRMGESSGPPG